MPGPLIDTGFSQAYATGLNSGTDLARMYMAQLQHDTQLGLERRRLDQQDDYHRLLTQDRQDRLDFRRQEHDDALQAVHDRLVRDQQQQGANQDIFSAIAGQPTSDWQAPMEVPPEGWSPSARALSLATPDARQSWHQYNQDRALSDDITAVQDGIMTSKMPPSEKTKYYMEWEAKRPKSVRLPTSHMQQLMALDPVDPVLQRQTDEARQRQEESARGIQEAMDSGAIDQKTASLMRLHAATGIDPSKFIKESIDKGGPTAESASLEAEAKAAEDEAAHLQAMLDRHEKNADRVSELGLKMGNEAGSQMVQKAQSDYQMHYRALTPQIDDARTRALNLRKQAAQARYPDARPGQKTPAPPARPSPAPQQPDTRAAQADAIIADVVRSNPGASPDEITRMVTERFNRLQGGQ